MRLKNGHQFHLTPILRGYDGIGMRDPREKHRPAGNGDFGCVLCGCWTTYCSSAEEADDRMGPCPNRKVEP